MTQTATVPTTNPTYEELVARIAEMERKDSSRGSNIKLGEKGNIVTYGLGKFPVSLYESQREKLFEIWGVQYTPNSPLKAFIESNRSKLSVKTKQ